jgi:hypothetical protein
VPVAARAAPRRTRSCSDAGGTPVASARARIDDPVGAISVHLVCGIWGTLAVGLFSTNPEHGLWVQLVGVGAYGAFTFACALAIFAAIRATLGLRVSEAEELEGLDLGEHGAHAYDLAGGPGYLEAVAAAARGGATAPARSVPASESA